MNRQQDRSEHFVGGEQMVQIGPAELPTGQAIAIGLQRPRISLVAGIS